MTTLDLLVDVLVSGHDVLGSEVTYQLGTGVVVVVCTDPASDIDPMHVRGDVWSVELRSAN